MHLSGMRVMPQREEILNPEEFEAADGSQSY